MSRARVRMAGRLFAAPAWRAALIALALLVAPGAGNAAAQGGAAVFPPRDSLLESARLQFSIGRIDSAAAILRAAFAADSAAATPPRLELLGRCCVRTGDVEGGVATFVRLLETAPEWTVDRRTLGGDELAVFERARREWHQANPAYRPPAPPPRGRPYYRQRRFQLAAAAVTAAVVILFQHQHSGGASSPLPSLPGHP